MPNNRVDIIQDLIEFVNNSELTKGLRVKFDELHVDSDSMCFSLAEDDTPAERFADVTGVAKVGEIKLDFFYRVISNVSGVGDIDSIRLVTDIFNNICENWRYATGSMYVIELNWAATPRLFKVYNGNIKDFITKIYIKYERMV